MVGENLTAAPLKLDKFDLEGLKARCRVEGCGGTVLISRDMDTCHLNPNHIYCTLCGQHYTIETEGLIGWPLEMMLRGEDDGRSNESS